MRRRHALVVAWLMTMCVISALAPTAQADDPSYHNFGPAHFVVNPSGTTTIAWRDSTGAISWGNGAQNGVDSWDNATTQVNFTKVTRGASIDFGLANLGIGLNQLCGQNQPTYYDTSTHLWSQTVVIVFNAQWTNSTPTTRKQCAVHEIGHALGLAHIDFGQCTNVQMMDPGNSRGGLPSDFYDCGWQDPRQGDVGGVNATY